MCAGGLGVPTLRLVLKIFSYFELNMSMRLSSSKDYEGLLEKYDTWMFDCDGVIWSGDHSIDGAIQALDMLRSRSMSTAMMFIIPTYLEFHISQREKGVICDKQCYQVTKEIQVKVRWTRHRGSCGEI